MSRPSLPTRARAWFLRTFKGRSRSEAGWTDEPAGAVSAPPQTFVLGDLQIEATPKGIKAAGPNPASAVWEVRVTAAGDARTWASRYGLPARDNSAPAAADAALDELDQIWRDPDGWKAVALAGMSEDEVEAMEDSPMMRLDFKAAQWIGPFLDAVRSHTKEETGYWV
ncbi:MAG: hypothetical protein WBD38_07270 [Candidatus Dormiibacterota bacterium]